MTLNDLITLASSAYPDNFLTDFCYDPTQQRAIQHSGDTLGEYIVEEIIETYESGQGDFEQLQTAQQVLMRGVIDLAAVVTHIHNRTKALESPRRKVEGGYYE